MNTKRGTATNVTVSDTHRNYSSISPDTSERTAQWTWISGINQVRTTLIYAVNRFRGKAETLAYQALGYEVYAEPLPTAYASGKVTLVLQGENGAETIVPMTNYEARKLAEELITAADRAQAMTAVSREAR